MFSVQDGLAGGGADPAREFREIVGRVQVVGRRLPVVVIDQVVPVRDLVIDRAAIVTERDAAIHAARGLTFDVALLQRDDELVVVPDPVARGLVGPVLTLDLEKSGDLPHHALLMPMFMSPVCSACIS